MTPREFIALKMVWAERQAMFHNAHFHAASEPSFIAEDFITPEARLLRKAKMLQDKAAAMAERTKLDMMRADDASGVPEAFLEMPRVN